MKKWKKRLLIVCIIVVILIFGVGIFIGNYFYNLALNPNADRSVVFGAPHNQMDGTRDNPDKPPAEIWAETVEFTEQSITSDDGLKLNAYRLEQEAATDKWVIVVHGYSSQAMYMKESAMNFYGQGFNVLMPDARGHGKSEGDYIGMGWHERKDMVKWAEEIIADQPDAQIVFYGVSMGGGTVMMTAGEELPENVKAIVEDCGYSSVKEEFAYQLNQIFGLPSFPVMNFASLVTKVRAGYTLEEASAVEQLKKAKVPILFIHGTEDTFVPYAMLDEVYEAAASEKEKFVVEGAGHGMAAAVAGEAYWDRVFDFIGKYLV